MNIGIGCPVKNRAWALPSWFSYIDQAMEGIGKPKFYFVLGTSVDDTEEVLLQELAGRSSTVVRHDENPKTGAQRVWNLGRYQQMVEARNLLLSEVRSDAPDCFLSVDSDIMVHPESIANLIESLEQFDAVGGKVYLNEVQRIPSFAYLSNRNSLHRRKDSEGVLSSVDVIMAMKLMGPQAYAVDYRNHVHGEDIGWSLACREQGLRLGWDGRICSKHVMRPELLNRRDKRVGY